jgi:sugar lactone lactonase YvrE
LVELRPDRVARYDELAATSPQPGPHTVPLRFPSLRRNRNRRAAGWAWPLATACAAFLFAASTSAQTSTTTLAVTAAGGSVATVNQGTAVTLTATVAASGAAVHPGQVKFCDATAPHCTDIHLLATAQLTSAGTATYKFIPGPGTHSYKAIFAGTKVNATSSSTAFPLTVNGASSTADTVAIAAAGSVGNYTLTANVSGGAAAATGSISFLDTTNYGYVLGTASLLPGSTIPAWSSRSIPSGVDPFGIAVGDFNGDGIPDMAIADYQNASVIILLGNGDGTFRQSTIPLPGSSPYVLLIGDFNNDGIADIAVANNNESTSGYSSIYILLGNGDGTFTQAGSPITVGKFAYTIVMADFNRDGNADLAVVDNFTDAFYVLLGHGDGSFTTIITAEGTNTPFPIAAADFNNDGIPDLAVGDTSGQISVFLGKGDGTFTAGAKFATIYDTLGFAVGDLRGDGNADIICLSGSTDPLQIWLGNGDGTFTAAPATPATAVNSESATIADFNGDGKPDIAIADSVVSGVRILLGNGDGTFAAAPTISGDTDPGYVVAADFNGDGVPDLALSSRSPDVIRLSIASVTPLSTAVMTNVSPVGSGTHYVDASYPGDSSHAANVSSTVPLTAKQAVTASVLTINPTTTTPGQPVTLTANVSPTSAQNHAASGTVTFYMGAVVIGTVSAGTSGVASMTTSGLPPGQSNITCVYSGDTNFATSNCNSVPLTIRPAAGSTTQTITFPQPAAPAYAGTTVALTATASSGLPVMYTVVSGPAVVSGNLLNYTGAGTVVIEADQAGNATYAAAAPLQDTVAATVLTEPIATTSASVSTLVTFTAAGTLASTHVFTQGIANLDFTLAQLGTVNGVAPCVSGAAYAVGQTCGIAFRFKPTRPGLRFGGIVLEDATGATLGNAYIYGLGTGPQLVYTPGVQSFVGSGYAHPSGAAVDASGNVYVSDYDANMVYEVPAGGGAQRSLGTFEQPDDVAVDGSGNVFVIYNRVSLAEIYAVNGVIPANPTTNVITNSLVSLNGMKVDGEGNIYLAAGDTGGGSSTIQEVLAVNGSIPASPTILTLVSSVGSPTGVAVDASGDVFFSDELGNTAWEALAVNGTIPASPTVRSLAPNLAAPANIAVDAAGDVYVCEEGDVAELLAVNGSVPASPTIVHLGVGLTYPQGMAVDAGGDLYIADSGVSQIVKLDYTDAPSLTFATTLVGSTSTDSPQTVTFFNDGNAGLTFLPPGSGTNPSITAGYTFTSTCPVLTGGTTAAYSVPPGATCAESISFTPVTGGVDSGALTLTDNDLNVSNAQQNIKLNATGTAAPTSLTLTSSANPANTLQPVTFTVRLNLSNGQAAGAGDAIQLTYSPNGTPIVVNLTTDATGTASYTVTGGFAVGTYTITTAFAGTNALQASSASLIEVVEPPQDFALTANPPSITIKGGRHGTMTLTLTSIGLFAGQVHLGCGTPLPPYLTCELLGTETLTANGSVSFPFEMDTDQILNFYGSAAQAPSLSSRPEAALFAAAVERPAVKPGTGSFRIALAMLLPLALAGFVRRRNKLRGLLMLVFLAVVVTGLSACGDKYPQQTPVGTYTIPVIATGTTSSGQVISHTLDVTLTVTP